MARPSSELDDLLSSDALLETAGERSFARGEEYFEDGRVDSLAEDEGVVSARVQGSENYEVRLWAEDGELESACTCPWAAEGNFCKHSVAVGLAWLARDKAVLKSKPAKGRTPAKPTLTQDDVRAMLKAEDKDHLVEMIMDQAANDRTLAERLLIKTARRQPGGTDIAAFRRVITDAFSTGGFVDWKGAGAYARRIHEAINGVEELLNDGHAAEAIELLEHALALCERALGQVDDSDGAVGEVRDRLLELHLQACSRARPEPKALARRLFDWEMKSDWDIFSGAARTYAEVLGPEGLAAYHKLAEPVWARLPALVPNDGRDSFAPRRYAITSIMETLADMSGDIEQRVAVRSRDLSNAYDFLQIAEIYRQAGQHDKAMEWAENGVKAFPERTDSRLREFLADEYHRRGKHEGAMALVWAEFSEDPGLDTYQRLKQHADRARQWPSWREDALTAIRERIAEAKSKRPRSGFGSWYRADHSDLVRIFLWEKDMEAAWQEAESGGCSDDLWMKLAAKREEEHPADAVAVYQRQVERIINGKNNSAYEEAVRLLRKTAR
ncbi:MAG: SWIM zinc finger family protein, partial [Armatimonadetes bacterium]|nr:SWIM zinc finger family protein [Armatimonadota bacterium]